MSETPQSNNNPTLNIEQTPDYILIRCIGGFNADAVRRLFPQAAALIRVPGRKVNVITDLTLAHQADREGANLMRDEARANRPFIRKSAVVGLTGAKRFIFDMVTRLAGRDDMRTFKTLSEAIDWVRQ